MKNNKLKNISSRFELASFLNVTEKSLIWYLYRLDPQKRYIKFQIPKKNGESRTINSPATYLKVIQKRLSNIVYEDYRPHSTNHGFVKEKSILTNAKVHIGSKWILNVDLKDFFSSINYGRVWGLLRKPPIECNDEISTLLAQIFCHDNMLPQGSPSAPIISNLICRRLDRELSKFAHRYRCKYTRYADDITISTKNRKFPKSIALLSGSESSDKVSLNRELISIINSNGFEINDRKTRLKNYTQRLEITGLTINSGKVNVQRKYVRQIRAMLNAWEKYGYDNAHEEYNNKYRKKTGNPKILEYSFRNVINGKLNFLRMIKGVDDPVYRKLRSKFEFLDPKFKGIRDHNLKKRLYQSTWCVLADDGMSQGTGFWLEGVGFVTCAHVVENYTDILIFNVIDNKSVNFKASVQKLDNSLDLAILTIDEDYKPEFMLELSEKNLQHDTEITVAGYPSYDPTNAWGIYIASGKTTQQRNSPFTHTPLWRVDVQISAGNSGGPVLDKMNRVIGIASRGGVDTTPSDSIFYGILSTQYAKNFLKNN